MVTKNKLVEELGLQDRVHFTEWFPNPFDLTDALRRARAFVFPSLAEANGIVVMEAMMMGLPTICLDWGGPALLITPKSGVLIEPTDEESVVKALAEAMDRLGEDGELADSMAQAGREDAEARGFVWPVLIQHWMGVYEELASSPDAVAKVPISG